MADNIWINAKAAVDLLAARPSDRSSVATMLVEMMRDGVLPARIANAVIREGRAVQNVSASDVSEGLLPLMQMRVRPPVAFPVDLDHNTYSFEYSRITDARVGRLGSSERVRIQGSATLYGLMFRADRLADLTGAAMPLPASAVEPNLIDAPQAFVAKRRGPKPKWNWTGLRAQIADWDAMDDILMCIIRGDIPQSHLEAKASEWFMVHCGETPAESAIRAEVGDALRARRERLEGGRQLGQH